MTVIQWLTIAGVIIIVGLSVYAGLLWGRVWRQQQHRKSREAQRNQRLAGDVQFLAQGMLSGQVPVIEGAIRIKVLLDNYSGPRPIDLDVEIFQRIYDSTAHIPTHQGWKELTLAERELHRRKMETLERDHSEAVENAARQLSEGLGNT